MKNFFSSLEDGFTFDLNELVKVTSGIIVAHQATQNCFGLVGFMKAFMHARMNNQALGGWHHQGKFYFDSCRIFTNREEAIMFGIENKQIAIFDLDNLEEIRLNDVGIPVSRLVPSEIEHYD
ncbi:hypothetical protein [Dyadobacter bucti]|uniref:hypothetical protein n=1 Tax=Dyadobacter bucti TaxID=2572203 RepID=UPI003F702CBF